MIGRRTRGTRTHRCALSGLALGPGAPAVAYVLAVTAPRPDAPDHASSWGRPLAGPVRLPVGSGPSGMDLPAFCDAALRTGGFAGVDARALVADLARGTPRHGEGGVAARLWLAEEGVYEAVRDSSDIAGAGHLDGAARLLEIALAWKASMPRRSPARPGGLAMLGEAREAPRVLLTLPPGEVAAHRVLAIAADRARSGIGRSVGAVTDAILAEVAAVRMPAPHLDRWRQGAAVAAEVLRMEDVLDALGRTWADEATLPAFPEPGTGAAAFVHLVTPVLSEAMGEPPSRRLQ